jgi:hypothetical protein
MLNPNQGFKKFVMKLKSRYTVSAIFRTSYSYFGRFDAGKSLPYQLLFRLAVSLFELRLSKLGVLLQCTVNKENIS